LPCFRRQGEPGSVARSIWPFTPACETASFAASAGRISSGQAGFEYRPTLPRVEKAGRSRFRRSSDRSSTRPKRNVAPEEYVLPAQRVRDVGINRDLFDRSKMPSSSQALRSLVRRVATRAGIAASIHPHLLRHVFADRIVRHAGSATRNSSSGTGRSRRLRSISAAPPWTSFGTPLQASSSAPQTGRLF
jgi:hypothetical protein